MRVWIDLANSPHVPLLDPIVRRLRDDGNDVVLTARDHAQTVELASGRWPDLVVVGGESPGGLIAKGRTITRRAIDLRRFARRERLHVAFSHGSYAQLTGARLAGVPAVTMMDYEHQPANHLSFRLARRVIVPAVFPVEALRRFGALEKAVRYDGFKEELYLSDFRPDPTVVDELGLDPQRVLVVLRPPPDGALYHRLANERFEQIVATLRCTEEVHAVLLPRSPLQRTRYSAIKGLLVPPRAIDALSLLAVADVAIGGGGTMNRESALLGTPTYTVFSGKLAAVDAELIRLGLLHDLRDPATEPRFEKKKIKPTAAQTAATTMEIIIRTLEECAA